MKIKDIKPCCSQATTTTNKTNTLAFKANLDILWLKEESLEDTENLPSPDILVTEIAENLESALEQFNNIIDELREHKNTKGE